MVYVDLSVKSTSEDEIILKNVSAILFDLDGTLIDSLDLHIESFQWILDKLGKDVDKEELEPLMGQTPQDIIKRFFSDITHEKLWSAAMEKEDYMSDYVDEVYVYPGIRKFLQKLGKLGIKRVVISSTHRELVKLLLKKANLFDYIEQIVSGDEISNGKPAPDPFLKGVEKVKVNPKDAVAIGDSIHDLKSSSNAGIRFIGVLTGKTDEKTFRKYNHGLIIDNISDISIVNSLN